MADEQSSDPRGRPSTPCEVEITILSVDRPPPLRERWRAAVAGRFQPGVLLMLGFIAAASLAAGAISGRHGGPPVRPRPADLRARQPGALGVAAAYGYPARCLSIDFAPRDVAYARADFDHRTPCGRFAGYPTAIFHRVNGVWRPVLEALGYVCPVHALPGSVQTALGVCPPTGR